MARISVDNGISYGRHIEDEALAAVDWDVIANAMDDETREKVHNELAPCTNMEFLERYLELAPEDLVIG